MTDQQPMPDLATHFDDPFLSDFQLRLVTPEDVTLAQFHVHGIVLAGQSGYFKSLLQNWMGQDARVFNITISEDELTAAKHMLQCAYSNCMPKDAKAEQLLATMVLADRYQLRVCVEACKARLLSLDLPAINWETTLRMLHLPPGLMEAEPFRALAQKALDKVWDNFNCLDEAWTNKALRLQWQQLPVEAIEAVLSNKQLAAASENVVYVVIASWLAAQSRQHASDPDPVAQSHLQVTARQLFSSMRYSHMTGNFLAAVASHHQMLAGQQEIAGWLLEAMQWAKASKTQQEEMMLCAGHVRFQQRVNASPELETRAGSAFTSYIAQADLQQAINKYRASNCSEAYYLLTAGHFYNGFIWRLKLTVKPPDSGSSNDMNIHVGLCWGVEIEGEGALPLAESTMVQVDFDIATWDFMMHEEDPTSSEGPVIIKAGTCWGWDDFFGPEVYSDPTQWDKFMTEKKQLLLSCHLYSCQ